MGLSLIALILVSVVLSASSQIVLKMGMSAPAVQRVLAESESIWRIGLTIGTSPLVLTGLFCFGLSAVLWLFVLSKVDVSTAYPCVALGIVLTVAAGHFLLGEPLAPLKVAGIAAIVTGVLLVAMSR
jgi:drug/metabolite transporter (DMT)-like permease